MDGAIPSMHPVYTDDPYLGRILAEIVAPPHTAGCVKRCISYVENIGHEITTHLFLSASNQAPMDDSGRMSILANLGPGYSLSEPLALVAKCSQADLISSNRLTSDAILLPSQEGASPLENRYRKSYLLFRISSCADQLFN
jgi:hypothetical protein